LALVWAECGQRYVQGGREIETGFWKQEDVVVEGIHELRMYALLLPEIILDLGFELESCL